MARSGDTTRPHSVKAEFDDSFSATSSGGAVLFEKAIRKLGLRSLFERFLPKRAGEYSSSQICEQVLAGLLCGGKGFQAAETLRRDALLGRIFGYERVAEEATVWRAFCQMADLAPRSFSSTYKPVGTVQPSLDLHGNEKKAACHERIVPDEPEAMSEERRSQFDELMEQVAVRCAQSLTLEDLGMAGYVITHGDGSALEVKGDCYDAARKDRNGNKSLQLMTVSVGPIYVGQRLLPGAFDEGTALAGLLKTSGKTVGKIAPGRPVLGLFDAAFAEKQIVDELEQLDWRYIICANQHRRILEKLAGDISEAEWISTGADASRDWAQSSAALMRHQPEGWSRPQTVIVRRYRECDQLPGTWHYSFLYTDLSAQLLPAKSIEKYGFAPYIWMLYSTKQGRENTYKTWLTDMGGHHPASGRLGASQAMCYVQAIAANVHSVISHRVTHGRDKGIRHWRFVRDYVHLAARVVMEAGRTLKVYLAGADLPEHTRRLWLEAYAAVQRL